MPADRARLDLDQLTERLLASRTRPKRQHLIEQITRIWSPPLRHCCLRPSPSEHRPHHEPTDASISAVASYANDPSTNVRSAVARALAASPDAARVAISVLRQLLSDESPL